MWCKNGGPRHSAWVLRSVDDDVGVVRTSPMRYGPANCTFEKATGPSNPPLGGQGEGSFQVPRNTRSLYGWHAVRSARDGNRRTCCAVPNGAPYGMRRARPFQPTDTKVMFAV